MNFGRRDLFLACLFLTIGRIPRCASWILQQAPSRGHHKRLHRSYSANKQTSHVLYAYNNDKGSPSSSSSEKSGWKKNDLVSRTLCNGIVSISLTAALFLGSSIAHASDVATKHHVLSSSSINVVEAVKTDGPSPPEIKTKSSAKALAISNKLKSLNAKMYGAYWCGHCADQKDTLGKEAFQNIEYIECSENGKNSQAGGLCSENDIRGYPTWEINGIKYSGERSLDELEKLVQMARASLPSHPKAPPQISSTSSDRAKKLSNQLAENNAALYGAYWCSHTFDQKEYLGQEVFAGGKIPYIECAKDGENSQIELCKKKKIRVVPTWEIKGELYEGERSLDDLEKIVQSLLSEAKSEAPPSKEASTPAPEKAESEEKKSKGDDTKDTPAVATKTDDKKSKADVAKDTTISTPKSDQSKDNDVEDSSTLAVTSEEKAAKESSKEDEPPQVLADEKTRNESPPKQSPAREKPSEESSTSSSKPQSTSGDSKEPPAIMAASSERTLALAKQLEKGDTKFYGGYFCRYCADQKELFGKEAFSKIKYIECAKDGKDSQFALCREKGITSVPVWEIYGKLYYGERDLEELETIVDAEMTIQAAPAESKKAAGEKSPAAVVSDEKSLAAVASEEKMSPPESASKEKAPPEIMSKSSDKALAIAKKLEEQNSKLYGAYWCGYTKEQKELLGKEALSKIRYVECSKDGKNSEIDACRSKKIQGYPTWEIGGKLYPGEQELNELEDILKESSQ